MARSFTLQSHGLEGPDANGLRLGDLDLMLLMYNLKRPDKNEQSHVISLHVYMLLPIFRRVWKPVVATAVVGGSAYYFYRDSDPRTFILAIKTRGADGRIEMSTRTIPLLPLKEAEARLQENAVSETHNRPNGISWTRTTAFLASNDPIEDAHSNQIIERDASDPSAPGDYLFFAVMDGHAGHRTSQLLSRVLIKGVALELSALTAESNLRPQLGLAERLKSLLWSTRPQSTPCPLDADPHRVSLAIQDAFMKLDAVLIQTPIRILANSLDKESRKMKKVPDLSEHPLALVSMVPAISGTVFLSCITITIFN
jgi:pyruvate dehydrogenase phosphatase